MSYGRYFEELESGQEFRHWPGRTITEFDDTLFSLMMMNQHPVHNDEHFAKTTQHGRRLVEGPVVISLVIGMSQADIGGRALATLEYRDIRHTAPVFHGDSIYADSVIVSKEDRDAVSGLVTVASRGRNQNGDAVVTMERVIVVPRLQSRAPEPQSETAAPAPSSPAPSSPAPSTPVPSAPVPAAPVRAGSPAARSGYGRYYQEFEAGAVYKHWPGRTIADFDNTWLALLSMNQNPLFIDAHFARQAGVRQPVIDTLVFGLLVGMSVADTSGRTIANLGYESVVFEQPLYPGDSLYGESEVLDLRESASKPDRGIVHIETRGFNQKGERVIVLRRSFLCPKRPAQSEG